MNAYFETADGRTVPIASPMSAEEGAVVMLMHATGIRRIDSETIDEFVHRADLYDTYVGGWLYESAQNDGEGKPVAMTRKILTDAMGEYVAVWTDANLLTPEEFNQMVQAAKRSR